MKFTDDPKAALKSYSFSALSAIGIVETVWATTPVIQEIIPPEYKTGITAVLALAGMIGRFIAQKKTSPAPQ